jgi:uncharacterized OB-fold protein
MAVSEHQIVEAAEWEKSLPRTDAVSAPYWEAAAQGRLLIQECPKCGHRQWYPRAMCTKCASEVEWLECSGRGEVHTFTVIRQMGMRPFRDELPYVIAMIQLEEGPLVFGNVTDVVADDVRIGLPVAVWFTKVDDEVGVASWRPA